MYIIVCFLPVGVFAPLIVFLSLDTSEGWSWFRCMGLMAYYGVVFFKLSGYQADEVKIWAQYKAIVDRYVSFVRSIFQLIFLGLKHAIPQARCGFSRLKSWECPMTPRVQSKLCRKVWSQVDPIHSLRLTRWYGFSYDFGLTSLSPTRSCSCVAYSWARGGRC